MNEGITNFVTATIFNTDEEHAVGSAVWQPDYETLEDAKEQALDMARERFDDDGFTDAVGVIYTVTKVRIPKLPSVTIEHEGTIEPVTIETVE